MANFLDATAEIELRINDYALRLGRIDAHVRRGERRAATAQLSGFLEELVEFAREIELPLETIVVGSQLGFFSGGELFRGRLPGALLGAAAGWLYGQQVMQRHRIAIQAMAEKVALITVYLEREAVETPAATSTEEIDRKPDVATTSDRVTQEVDRE